MWKWVEAVREILAVLRIGGGRNTRDEPGCKTTGKLFCVAGAAQVRIREERGGRVDAVLRLVLWISCGSVNEAENWGETRDWSTSRHLIVRETQWNSVKLSQETRRKAFGPDDLRQGRRC